MRRHRVSYFYRFEPAWLYVFLVVIGNRYRIDIIDIIQFKNICSNRMCLLREEIPVVERSLHKGCVSKRGNPISHFDLSTLFGNSVLALRSTFKVSRWGVGAQVQRA